MCFCNVDEVTIQADLADKKPLLMTREDWEKHEKRTDCHIGNKSLIKDIFGLYFCVTMILADIAVRAKKRCFYETIQKINQLFAHKEKEK